MNKAQQIIEGLTILNAYPGGCEVNAQHDVLYAGPGVKVSEEDAVRLQAAHWHWSEHEECWSVFT